MTLKAHLRKILLADEAVQALAGDRVYSGRAATGTVHPFVMLFISGTDFSNHLRGTAESKKKNLQVDCISKSSDEADLLQEAVIKALNDYRGAADGTKIHSLKAVDAMDDNWSDDVGLHRRVADFKLTYSDYLQEG